MLVFKECKMRTMSLSAFPTATYARSRSVKGSGQVLVLHANARPVGNCTALTSLAGANDCARSRVRFCNPTVPRLTCSTGYRLKHRENRAASHLQRLLASMPVYPMWDDHEVQNNFDSKNSLIPLGRRAFQEYRPIRGATANSTVLYRHFSWGAGADFFILDCRQYRRPMFEILGPARTMLGRTQKEWFQESIRASKAPSSS